MTHLSAKTFRSVFRLHCFVSIFKLSTNVAIIVGINFIDRHLKILIFIINVLKTFLQEY